MVVKTSLPPDERIELRLMRIFMRPITDDMCHGKAEDRYGFPECREDVRNSKVVGFKGEPAYVQPIFTALDEDVLENTAWSTLVE